MEGVAEGTRSKAAMKKAKQKEKNRQEDISEDWLSLAGAEVLPSAKTLAIKAQILNWTREDPKVKIIVYTQFLAMYVEPTETCFRIDTDPDVLQGPHTK